MTEAAGRSVRASVMAFFVAFFVRGAWLTGGVGWLLALPYAAIVLIVAPQARIRPRVARRRQRGGKMMRSGSSTRPPP